MFDIPIGARHIVIEENETSPHIIGEFILNRSPFMKNNTYLLFFFFFFPAQYFKLQPSAALHRIQNKRWQAAGEWMTKVSGLYLYMCHILMAGLFTWFDCTGCYKREWSASSLSLHRRPVNPKRKNNPGFGLTCRGRQVCELFVANVRKDFVDKTCPGDFKERT